jgi:hypothetical protein
MSIHPYSSCRLRFSRFRLPTVHHEFNKRMVVLAHEVCACSLGLRDLCVDEDSQARLVQFTDPFSCLYHWEATHIAQLIYR